jgi:Mg2+ and Co2+ transporter CorA
MSERNAPSFNARLFRAQARDQEVSFNELPSIQTDDQSLLWVDLVDPSDEELAHVWKACELPSDALHYLHEGTTPSVAKEGEYFWLRVVAVSATSRQESLCGIVLTLVAGCNRVVSIHSEPLSFIGELLKREDEASQIGGLCAESFVASLLDWHLSTYFQAVSDYEMAIERTENDILDKKGRTSLAELQRLRRWASRLRRMLAPHRFVFSALSRPDFRPSESRSAERHFVALDTRYERAMDMVENARELVLGSFDLFSSQTALQTNQVMRVLTFVTVITGVLATMVGALGMNFDAALFKTQDAGFWSAVIGLCCLTAGALLAGRWRRWF